MSLLGKISNWIEKSIEEDVEEPVVPTDFSFQLFRKYFRFLSRLYWELFGCWKFLIRWHTGGKKKSQVLVRLSGGELNSNHAQWIKKRLSIYRLASLVSLATASTVLLVYLALELAGFLYLSIAFFAFLFFLRRYGDWCWSLKREYLWQERKASKDQESSCKGGGR